MQEGKCNLVWGVEIVKLEKKNNNHHVLFSFVSTDMENLWTSSTLGIWIEKVFIYNIKIVVFKKPQDGNELN